MRERQRKMRGINNTGRDMNIWCNAKPSHWKCLPLGLILQAEPPPLSASQPSSLGHLRFNRRRGSICVPHKKAINSVKQTYRKFNSSTEIRVDFWPNGWLFESQTNWKCQCGTIWRFAIVYCTLIKWQKVTSKLKNISAKKSVHIGYSIYYFFFISYLIIIVLLKK